MTGKKWIRHLIPNLGTVIAVILLLFAYRVWAGPLEQSASSGVISYQGYLTNTVGQPVNGTANMTFRLYTQTTGGTALWTEAHTGGNAVPVGNGLFNVLLGSQTEIPATVWENAELYLGITVGSDAEMTPRERVGRVPFAMAASHALTADVAAAAVQLDAPDGAPSPAVRVTDDGWTYVGPNPGALVIEDATAPNLYLDRTGDNFGEWAIRANGENFEIWEPDTTGDPVRFFIDNGGSVGIGTTAPSALLDVEGTFEADSLRVAGTKPIFFQRIVNIGHHYWHWTTSYSSANWICGLVSVRANGNLNENYGGSLDLFRAQTYVDGGVWHVFLDFTNEDDVETWEATLMCVDTDLAEWKSDMVW